MKATQENYDSDFFQAVLKLKTIPRQGWKNKLGLKNPESVADHCYSLTAMAMLLSDVKGLNTEKIIRMALLHDLAESITGDLTPDEISKSKKEKLERLAMKEILKKLDAKQRTKYWCIWTEYQKNTSKEATLLHQIDKLEMAYQAKLYHVAGHNKSQLVSFLESARSGITDSDLKKTLSKLFKD